jgi:hypothetical protein
VGDIARFSRVDYDEDDFARMAGGETSADDAALGFNVRIGRELGERWGVELEFARTGEFESQASIALPAVLRETLDLRVPFYGFDYKAERTQTMIAALAWVRQDLGERVELGYLGGISFNRVETEQEYTGPRILIYPPISVPGYESIDYGIGPEVGVEVAVKFGSAAVTSGIRLQSAIGGTRGGWLIRPNVGMRWRF